LEDSGGAASPCAVWPTGMGLLWKSLREVLGDDEDSADTGVWGFDEGPEAVGVEGLLPIVGGRALRGPRGRLRVYICIYIYSYIYNACDCVCMNMEGEGDREQSKDCSGKAKF
jgi:hypothetical protein